MCGKTFLNSPNFNLFPKTLIFPKKKHFPPNKISHKSLPERIIAHRSISPAGQQPDPVPGLVQLVRLAAAGLAHPQHEQPHHLVRRPGGRPAQVFTFEQSSFPHKKYFPPDCKVWGWSTTSCLATAGSPGFSTMRRLLPLPGGCLSPCLRINSHEESVVILALLGPLQLHLEKNIK